MNISEPKFDEANDPIVEVDAEGFTALHVADDVSLSDIGSERLAFRDDDGRLYIANVPGLKVEFPAAGQPQ